MAAHDVLGDVYDYVREFAQIAGRVPAYRDDQIVRAQQNAMVMPPDTEFCVLSYLRSVRHGTTAETFPDEQGGVALAETLEHIVQVDIYGAEPFVPGEVTRERAQALELASRSGAGCRFFSGRGLGLLYADDVAMRPGWDDAKNYTMCYSLTLHLEQAFTITRREDYFTALNVRSVAAHDPDTRPNIPGWLQTENVDTDHT